MHWRKRPPTRYRTSPRRAMPAKFHPGSTTWAILLGEQLILARERLEPPSGATAPCHPRFLGVLPGGDYSCAASINDAGQVAGASNIGDAIVPFIWKPAHGMQRIPLLPGDKC